MTTLEIAANAVTTISIVLAARNSIHTWWTGIIGAVLFGMLFYQNQLYADVALQGFFAATSVVGWWRWRGAIGAPLPVTYTGWRLLVLAGVGGIIVALAYGTLLQRYTDAYAPFWDSLVLVASVIAQVLLINRKFESWYVWLAVNTLAAPLYASRGLWLTSALYVAYWINALFALKRWRQEMS